MSLSTGRYQLSNAFKTLKQEWLATEDSWRDVVRKDFADQFWDPLTVRLSALLTATDQLDQAMVKMRQECE
jgi:hypothetical protein